MTARQWRFIAALPLILLYLALRVARFAITIPLAVVSATGELVTHGEWHWPSWRSIWGGWL